MTLKVRRRADRCGCISTHKCGCNLTHKCDCPFVCHFTSALKFTVYKCGRTKNVPLHATSRNVPCIIFRAHLSFGRQFIFKRAAEPSASDALGQPTPILALHSDRILDRALHRALGRDWHSKAHSEFDPSDEAGFPRAFLLAGDCAISDCAFCPGHRFPFNICRRLPLPSHNEQNPRRAIFAMDGRQRSLTQICFNLCCHLDHWIYLWLSAGMTFNVPYILSIL